MFLMFVPTITLNIIIMKVDLTKLDCIEVDGIDTADYPDFVDAFISYAEIDGKELSDEQYDYVNEQYDFVYECVQNELF